MSIQIHVSDFHNFLQLIFPISQNLIIRQQSITWGLMIFCRIQYLEELKWFENFFFLWLPDFGLIWVTFIDGPW